MLLTGWWVSVQLTLQVSAHSTAVCKVTVQDVAVQDILYHAVFCTLAACLLPGYQYLPRLPSACCCCHAEMEVPDRRIWSSAHGGRLRCSCWLLDHWPAHWPLPA